MTGPVPFTDALRAELLAAATRQVAARRRRARALGVARAGVVALVLVLGGASALRLTDGGVAAADVVVRVADGEVLVRLEDLEHRPDRIEAALREAGLDVRVDAVPVGPSRVGRFVGHGSTGALPPELRRLDLDPTGFRSFALPLGWRGSLRILVGAPAGPQQPYAVFSDATLPGEPLACRPVVGMRARELAAEAGTIGLSVRYLAEVDGQVVGLDAASVADGPEGGWTVTGVEATSRRAVVARVSPEPLPVAPPAPAGCR